MDKLSCCRPPKSSDEWDKWWESLNSRQKIAEFERWVTCPCDDCSLFRELIGEQKIRNAIGKAKKRIEE